MVRRKELDVWGLEERYVFINHRDNVHEADLELDVHRLAAFFENQGVSKNDFVAVFMTNSPEMIITVLALSKLSAVAGLINTNLRGEHEATNN